MITATIHTNPDQGAAYRSHWGDLGGIEFEQRWVLAGDRRARVLHAGRHGDPAVLLLGGTGDPADIFTAILGAYGRQFDTYAVDFLGCGYTDKPDLDYDTFEGAVFLEQLLTVLQLDRVALVGVAVGTWYAMRFASAHPEKTTGLVMIAPHAGPGYHYPIVNLDSQAVRDRVALEPTWGGVRELLERRIKNRALVAEDLVASRLAALRQPDAARAVAHQAFYLDHALHDRNALTAADLSAIRCPCLWIVGNPTPKHWEELQPNLVAMPGPHQVVAWTGVGAWPFWEDPVQFCEISLPFLSDTCGGGGVAHGDD